MLISSINSLRISSSITASSAILDPYHPGNCFSPLGPVPRWLPPRTAPRCSTDSVSRCNFHLSSNHRRTPPRRRYHRHRHPSRSLSASLSISSLATPPPAKDLPLPPVSNDREVRPKNGCTDALESVSIDGPLPTRLAAFAVLASNHDQPAPWDRSRWMLDSLFSRSYRYTRGEIDSGQHSRWSSRTGSGARPCPPPCPIHIPLKQITGIFGT